MRVKATRKGWFGNRMRSVGEEFVITSRLPKGSSKDDHDTDIKAQVGSWMQVISSPTKTKTKTR